MRIIGHRGCADQYPENTVAAVTETCRRLDAVEVDVRRCGSGELVVFHDERVDALTDGTGRVDELDWAELRALEVGGSGEPIPKLETLLGAVTGDVRLQLELKECGLAADVRQAVDEALATHGPAKDGVATAGRASAAAGGATGSTVDAGPQVAVSSFRAAALAEVADLGWDVPTGYLFESDPAANLERALELNCSAVHPQYRCCLETDIVDRAHERGLDVIAWKAAKTPEEVARLREAGVDGVTADRWDLV